MDSKSSHSGIKVPSHSRPVKGYMDAHLASLSSVIDKAKSTFLRMKEERKVKDLYDKICHLRHIPEERIMNEEMYTMLENIHLHREYLPVELKRFEVLLKTCCINGVGFWNVNGGISFFSTQIGNIACVGQDGLTILFNKRNQKSVSVCVFENFLDYLSYRMLLGLSKRHIESDVLILNSVSNFVEAFLECKNYKTVLLFFQKDQESSQVMNKTFTREMVGVSKDMSYIYADSGFSNLLDFIATLNQEDVI